MEGIKGDDEEQPANNRARGIRQSGFFEIEDEGLLTEQYYRYGNEDHKNMMITQKRYQS